MISLEELYGMLAENSQKKIEIEAEERVLNKLIQKEKSKCVEQPCEETTQEEIVEENTQQDESY